MIGYYNYTVILTYISLIISSVGIYLAAAGHPFYALCCLLASGICDMFDGKIARTRKKSTAEEKRFGIQIDSLCDVICFGVLPATVGVCLLPSSALIPRMAVWAIAALYVLCGLIRLAYFNVTEETRQSQEGGRRTHFQGIPITTAAVVFPMAYAVSQLCASLGSVAATVSPWLYPAILLLTGIAFITPVRVRKPRGVGLAILGLVGLCEFGFMLWLLLR